MTQLLKIIHSTCYEVFHVKTIFCQYHCTEGSVHLLLDDARGSVGCKK